MSDSLEGAEPCMKRLSVTMETTPGDEGEGSKRPLSGSFKRRSIIRRRSSKRTERPEMFGRDTKAYDEIRERVLQERAVTNAIEALQERWRMLNFMYDDCVTSNEERKEKRIEKVCVQRQLELIIILAIFIALCVPVILIIVIFCIYGP